MFLQQQLALDLVVHKRIQPALVARHDVAAIAGIETQYAGTPQSTVARHRIHDLAASSRKRISSVRR